jgi:ornithine cyclodeaminase/alanine dehydrogenase-like protein (mu-crystallin family)
MAALATRPLRDVRVYSPRAASRDAFVADARVRHPAVDIRSVDNADACVGDADVIMAATSSMARVVDPKWLRPGVHVSCVKAQEVDQSVLDACDHVVVHLTAQPKQDDNVMAGTLNVPAGHQRGWWNMPGNRFAEYPTLAQLVAGTRPGRRHDGEVTCFVNNVGIGLQFAAAGALVFEKALRAGVGRELPDEWFSETVHP